MNSRLLAAFLLGALLWPAPGRAQTLITEIPGASVTFRVTGNWGVGFNGEVVIRNLSSQPLQNWRAGLRLDATIGNIWNARIVSKDGPLYQFDAEGLDWNNRIPPGGTAGFGFTATSPLQDTPSNLTLQFEGRASAPTGPTGPTAPKEPTPSPSPTPAGSLRSSAEFPQAEVVFLVTNDWGAGFEAKVTIRNKTSAPISNWRLALAMDRSITSVWSARVSSVTGSKVHFDASGFAWNSGIPAGGQISFGLIGAPGGFVGVPKAVGFSASGSEQALPSASPSPAAAPTPASPPFPMPTTAPATAPATGRPAFNYAEVLQKSLYFYDAQRSGRLPDNFRVDWRGDSALGDGNDVGIDLSGGYYDAGDHMKFALPMASAITLLAWGGIEYPEGYRRAGQWGHLLDAVRWGADWLMKAHPRDRVFYAQVGDGHADHAYWGPPEKMTMWRPSFAVTALRPGSEVTAEAAAALAATSILFRKENPVYANLALDHARRLFDFADRHRGVYSDSIPQAAEFYKSWSGYYDELLWAAVWLYRATGEMPYLVKAEGLFNRHFAGAPMRWTHDWDNKNYGAAILLARATGKETPRRAVENWLDHWVHGGVRRTPGGLAWLSQWGSLRYAATTAFLAFVYADTIRDHGTRYRDFARSQIDYILGKNPAGRSYVVGFGKNSPRNPHHRAAHGSKTNSIHSPSENRHVLYGALVGGPPQPDDFSYRDERTDYISNEVAIDYNAGFQGAISRLVITDGGEALPDFPPGKPAEKPAEAD